MLVATQILRIIARVLPFVDSALVIAHRPNPINRQPLPFPTTVVAMGLDCHSLQYFQLLSCIY